MTNRVEARSGIALAVLLILFAAIGTAGAQVKTDGGDPFARLDAQLNDAAARTLDRVVQPDSPLPPQQILTDPVGASTPSLNRGNQSALQRVERLRPVLEPILRQVGVPTDLAAVVLVESGGNPTALSPKGARGLWQLMPETARRYGLVVNNSLDERLDIFKATRAAAEYLRDLFAQFHNWPLALAAYNAGEQAVQRAMTRTGSNLFSPAASALPLETQNYVPAVLHAIARFTGSRIVPNTRVSPRIVYAAAVQ